MSDGKHSNSICWGCVGLCSRLGNTWGSKVGNGVEGKEREEREEEKGIERKGVMVEGRIKETKFLLLYIEY